MSTSTKKESEIETYIRVRKNFDKLYHGMQTSGDSNLCNALDALSCLTFMTTSTKGTNPSNLSFTIAGENAGTFAEPRLDQIIRNSAPSSFGKGDQWVMDLAYRNGHEITGHIVEFGRDAHRWIQQSLTRIATTMFAGRQLSYRFHKLAVYTEGGHFDWHLDATHSNEHQATLLIALNTPWEGGDLILRRNGVETRLDMQPKTDAGPVELQAVVFYTDTEHKVEQVTKGARIILQFDIVVVGWKDRVTTDGDTVSGGAVEIDLSRGEWHDGDLIVEDIEKNYSKRVQREKSLPNSTISDPRDVNRVVAAVRDLLESGEREVGFALQYLHRKASIQPEYLKGSDALVYQALARSEDLDVSIRPVVLVQMTDYEGSLENAQAYIYGGKKQGAQGERQSRTTFHLNQSSGITLVHSEDFIEHRGNEPEPGQFKYFGGGIFVRFK